MPPTRPAHTIESSWNFACDSLGQKVAANFTGDFGSDGCLYGPNGERKYLNREERLRFLAKAETLDSEGSLFALLLAWTGARISEVLALTPSSFQVEAGVVTILTLKRRKLSPREVPIPPGLMSRIARCFSLRQLQSVALSKRLWNWHRVTAWRLVKRVMVMARISGRQACPRGLRHGFGIGTLQSGVPIHLIQRWMGHARLSTTMIYMAVCGPEELDFARRFWRSSPPVERADASLAA